MKKLRLIRHAKSAWDDPMLSDKQRPLKNRVRRDAKLVGGHLDPHQWDRTRIFCSTAVRARETLALLCAASGDSNARIEHSDRLYTFDDGVLVDYLRKLSASDVTLVGHNPALHDLVEWLSGAQWDNLPTCAYCELDIDIAKWSDLSRGTGSVRRYITPRMLKTGEVS